MTSLSLRKVVFTKICRTAMLIIVAKPDAAVADTHSANCGCPTSSGNKTIIVAINVFSGLIYNTITAKVYYTDYSAAACLRTVHSHNCDQP